MCTSGNSGAGGKEWCLFQVPVDTCVWCYRTGQVRVGLGTVLGIKEKNTHV